jgi:hypothetical protein
MPLEPTAELRASASTLVEALFGQARATAGHAQEGTVTYVGDADGALEVTVAGEPHRIIARPVESLRLGDAVFVRPLNEYAWAPWLYEQFSHRGDVAEDHPLYFQPRLPYVLNLLIGSASEEMTVGNWGDIEIGAPVEVTGCTVYSEEPATVVFEVLATTYQAYPEGFASITNGTHPQLFETTKSRDLSLAGWTTRLPPDTVLRFQVLSAEHAFRVTVALAVA